MDEHEKIRALRVVLQEFVNDVEVLPHDDLVADWPDLLVTYRHAKAVLAATD